MSKRTREEIEAENRELRAALGWDKDYSEVAELREMLDRCRAENKELGSLAERERHFEEQLTIARQRSDAFFQAVEAAFMLLRL